MSTLDQTARALETPAVADRPAPRRPRLGDMWWRHLVALAALAFALFPIAYIISAAFSADGTLSGASLIPRALTLDHFSTILSGTIEVGGDDTDIPYLRWYVNTLIVATATAITTVLLGALAAYAFSRFRFKGRRLGMLGLLLIQMFPQLLLVVAIYLIILNTGDVFSFIGLNTLTGLMVVYLGGAMGVNTWLLKGFFDTIPRELDESARVDGATPVLAVVALISFVATINEFVIASVLLQDRDSFTLPLGMRSFIDKQYAEQWGPFAAGVLLAALPVTLLFAFLQRFIVSGLTQGSVKG